MFFIYHFSGVSNLNVRQVGASDQRNETRCDMSLRSAVEIFSEYLFLCLLRVGCQQSGQLMSHFCMVSSQLKATCECKINILLLNYSCC